MGLVLLLLLDAFQFGRDVRLNEQLASLNAQLPNPDGSDCVPEQLSNRTELSGFKVIIISS